MVLPKFPDFVFGTIGTGIVDHNEFDVLVRLLNHRTQRLLHEILVVIGGTDDGYKRFQLMVNGE